MNKDYEKIEVLRCKHCMEFHAADKATMLIHLDECVANPKNKTCLMCKHLTKHNIVDVESGKPTYYFMCSKLKQVKDEFEITDRNMECFEEREDKQLPHVNSKAYEDYLEELIPKIEKTMR